MKILIADDHEMLREGIRLLCDSIPAFQVVAEAGNGRDAVELARKYRPDVVIMDISMPDLNGVDATRMIREACPSSRVVGLSAHAGRKFVIAMLRAGASGYMLKGCKWDEISKAIYAVAEGRIYLSEELRESVIKDYLKLVSGGDVSSGAELSGREREILRNTAEGKSSRETACALDISVRTVDVVRRNIMKKLGINSVAELTKYAIVEGLTSL
ncbi:MAG TPA: response regulator transcription factor [Thermodesulfovibrionales bacterium]|nr:response regulator transcription factor [Thermodesulfovibrionales bacterium]